MGDTSIEICATKISYRNTCYQDIQRPLLREEGDGAPASSGTQ